MGNEPTKKKGAQKKPGDRKEADKNSRKDKGDKVRSSSQRSSSQSRDTHTRTNRQPSSSYKKRNNNQQSSPGSKSGSSNFNRSRPPKKANFSASGKGPRDRRSFDRKLTDQKPSDRGPRERKYNNRETSGRKPSDRGSRDRSSPSRKYSDRKPSDRGPRDQHSPSRKYSDKKPSDRGPRDQHSPNRKYSDKKPSDRGPRDHNSPKRNYSDRKPSDRGPRDYNSPKRNYSDSKPSDRGPRGYNSPNRNYTSRKPSDRGGMHSQKPPYGKPNQRRYDPDVKSDARNRSAGRYGSPHSQTLVEGEEQPERNKGLPKISGRVKKAKSADSRFSTLNSTNVALVREYFDTISPNLYEILATKENFALYLFEGTYREVYLVPSEIRGKIRKLATQFPIQHAGIHLGYMRRTRTRTGFARAFFLSYEGGEFLLDFLRTKYPEEFKLLQVVNIDHEGEQAFLYGRNLNMDSAISDTDDLIKKKLIFILNEKGRYLGLALLLVKQAGVEKPAGPMGIKRRDIYSRSQNFTLSLMNLIDAGYYLRSGG